MECPHCGAQSGTTDATCRSCGRELLDDRTVERNAADEPTIIDYRSEQKSRTVPPRQARSPHSSFSLRRLDPGTDLSPRYHIVHQLGEGGMGEVYLAHDRELDRDVALKLIRSELARDETAMERFRREIQLSSRITHRNILRVFDVGEADGVKFLTMEYVDGENLAVRLRREGRLPIETAIDIFRQMCEGLAAAHEIGVIHRDLKPQNVMIDVQGRVAIADFGLAKSLEQATLTDTGKVIGTPHYMSPEQVKGSTVDRRSDIYSLGIILYEMLTGVIPFSGGSAFEIMIQRVHTAAKPASDHNPQIPPYLQKIVHRCLETDPALRYGSTTEILHDLGTRTAHTTVGYHMRKRRTLAIVAASVIVILLAAAAAVTVRRLTISRERAAEAAHRPISVLVADLDNKTGEAVFDGTLEPIVTLAMEGASFISSYNRRDAHRVASQIRPDASALDAPLARLVAVREGVGAVIGGALSREADGYQLALSAIDPVNGNQIGSSVVTAPTKEQMLSAVGRAAADLRRALGDTTPMSVQMAAAETFTTSSLEAAHEYGAAQDLYYHGEFENAAEHYEKAVRLDPNLGRAYAGLAASYANLGRKSDAEAYYKQAMSHLDRMTDREKFRTRGAYYIVTRNNARAIDELTQLVKEYPSDMAGLNNLAVAYFNSRDMKRALQLSQKPIELYPKNAIARSNAALFAMYAGDFATAVKLAQTALSISSTYTSPYIAIALSRLGEGDAAAATQTYQKLATIGPRGVSVSNAGLADLALYEGRINDAIALLKSGAERDREAKNGDAANRKLATLAAAFLMAGDGERAAATAEEASRNLQASHDQHALYTAGHVLAETGRDSAALDVASRLTAQFEPELQLHGKLIEGEVLLHGGHAREAVTKFDEAARIADAWLVHLDRGRAYLDAGAFTEASADFETCLKRRGEATAVFLDDVPTAHFLPPVYYHLARAQEGLGSASAQQSYRQFLAIKAKGDAAPLVADARRRLAALFASKESPDSSPSR